MRRLTVLGAVLAALAGWLTIPPAYSTDQPATTGASLLPEHQEAAALLMRDVPGLTPGEAIQRVREQEDRALLLESLATSAADRFGGGWYDRVTGLQHLVVADEETAEYAAREATTRGVQVEVHYGTRSYGQLVDLADRAVSGALPHLPALTPATATVHLDVPQNVVRIDFAAATLPPPSARTRAAEDSPGLAFGLRMDSPTVSVKDTCYSRTNCDSPLRSGIEVTGGYSGCSLGYWWNANDGSKWASSAGHCVTALNDVVAHNGRTIGPVRDFRNTTGMDIARARIDNSYWLNGGGGWQYNARDLNNPLTIGYAITNRSSIQEGETVCLNALHSTLGVSCGVITEDWSGYNEVRVSFDACPGDSGGAWTWRTSTGVYWAYGSHVSSASGCHGDQGGNHSDFQTVPDINAFWDSSAPGAGIRIKTR